MAISTLMEESKDKADLVPWWLVLLEGLAALIIGIYLIVSPIAATIILVGVLGWYWLIVGISTLVTILIDKTNWIWRAVSGLLGILAGLVVISHPLFSAVLVPEMVVITAGILVICFGFIRLFWAMKEGWGAAIMGVINIILGVLILGQPLVGITMLVYLVAVLGIVGGIATIYLALKLRS
ncbi:MAG: DUF308 domain-containing protein [Methanothrix sp.]|nr:DUF308 domain-containing protein [Methanothrix sp.]